MRVHLIKKQSLYDYIDRNNQSKTGLILWTNLLKEADWYRPSDILKTYNTADLLGRGSKRVVFNIGGNKYRLICSYFFGDQMVHLFVKWIGTHAEYTQLCQQLKQYSIGAY